MLDESGRNLKEQKIELICAIVILVVAFGLIIGGIAYTVVMANKTNGYVEVESAVIVDIVKVEEKLDSERKEMKTMYAEIVEYVVDGQTYSAQNTRTSDNQHDWRISRIICGWRGGYHTYTVFYQVKKI